MKICNENPGEVSLLCIAPLTNIATALCIDPDLASKVDQIYIMGTTIYGKGNTGANLEFNFATDPHAVSRVFESFKLIHLCPWEACHEYEFTKEETLAIMDEKHPKSGFYGNVNMSNYKKYG